MFLRGTAGKKRGMPKHGKSWLWTCLEEWGM